MTRAGNEEGRQQGLKGGLGHRWLTASLLLSVAGCALSLYSIRHHLQLKQHGSTDAGCNINALVNCDAVAASPYSELWGIPLGGWGLGYFLALLALSVVLWLGKGRRQDFLSLYSALVVGGAFTALGLALLSLLVVKVFCLVCIGLYAVILGHGVLFWLQRKLLGQVFSLAALLRGAWVGLLSLLVVLLAFQAYKSSYYLPEASSESADLSGDGQSLQAPVLAMAVATIPLTKTAYAGLGEDYRRGGDEAKVVITVFSDFQCPSCKRMSERLASLEKDYGQQVLVVYRNFPLDQSCNSSVKGAMHLYACKAAALARCAGQYGKFWDYHDRVFANQGQISAAKLEEWGLEVGLSQQQMASCLKSDSILEKIKDDVKLGLQLGIDATPTLYLNGRKVLRNELRDLQAEIDRILHIH